MARIIQKFDWGQINRITTKERSEPYPWEKWLDGRIHLLTFGEDFTTDPVSFVRVARTSANRGSATREPVGIRVRRGPFDSIEGSTEMNVILQAHRDGAGSPYLVTKSKRFDNGEVEAPKVVTKAPPKAVTTKPRAVKAGPATAKDFAKAKAATNVVALPSKPVPSKRRALKVG